MSSLQILSHLIDVKTAAVLLSVSQPTIRRLVKTGKLKFHKIGDRILFSNEDISSFVKSCAFDSEGSK